MIVAVFSTVVIAMVAGAFHLAIVRPSLVSGQWTLESIEALLASQKDILGKTKRGGDGQLGTNVLRGVVDEAGVSTFAEVRWGPAMKPEVQFEISTEPPPPLTPEALVRGEAARPWVRSIRAIGEGAVGIGDALTALKNGKTGMPDFSSTNQLSARVVVERAGKVDRSIVPMKVEFDAVQAGPKLSGRWSIVASGCMDEDISAPRPSTLSRFGATPSQVEESPSSTRRRRRSVQFSLSGRFYMQELLDPRVPGSAAKISQRNHSLGTQMGPEPPPTMGDLPSRSGSGDVCL
jgi:hypothetical protein